MNQLISKTITLIIGFSIAFSSAIPMQNANAYVTKVEVVSPIEIAAEPSSTFPDIQSSASLQVEAQSVGRSNEPEYEVIQNDDPYLMSLALGYEELKSQYGPNRNDPDEGIPEHAYSPFDKPEPRTACPSGGCDMSKEGY